MAGTMMAIFGFQVLEFVCCWLVVGCRSIAEAVEQEEGSCMEGHKAGFVLVLVRGTLFVVL